MSEPRKPLPEFVLVEGLEENRLELLAAEAPAQGQGQSPKPRKFKMLAYSGGEMIVGYWGRVVVDVAGVQLPAGSFPILRSHDPNRIAGMGLSVKADGGKIRIEGTLSGVTADGAEVAALGDEGFPWQASVGLKPLAFTDVAAGGEAKVNGKTFKGPVLVVAKSVLKESSFVPLGADDKTVGTVLAASAQLAAQTSAPPTTEGAPAMAEENKTPAAPVQASIKELKALEGADGDFVVAQFEKGATLAEAREALQAREIARLKAENEELKKTPPAPVQGKKPAGVAPLQADKKEGAEGVAAGDPRAEFFGKVDELAASGMPRDKAVSRVAAKHPELHRAMLEAANADAKDGVDAYFKN